jgi:hypothetical protein
MLVLYFVRWQAACQPPYSTSDWCCILLRIYTTRAGVIQERSAGCLGHMAQVLEGSRSRCWFQRRPILKSKPLLVLFIFARMGFGLGMIR